MRVLLEAYRFGCRKGTIMLARLVQVIEFHLEDAIIDSSFYLCILFFHGPGSSQGQEEGYDRVDDVANVRV